MADDDGVEQNGADEDDDLEEVEIVETVVGPDGTVVVDDVVAEVDAEGNVVAAREIVTYTLPDGEVIVEETDVVEVADGEWVVDETVAVVDDEGRLVPVAEEMADIEIDDSGEASD